MPLHTAATCFLRCCLHLLDRAGKASSRHPDAEPAVAQTARPADHRRGTTANEDRYRLGGDRFDQGSLDGDELALEGDWSAPEQSAQHAQVFVHPAAPGPRVHPTDLEFVWVLASDSHSEEQPAGSHGRDVRDLAGDRHRVAQGQQVHRHGCAESFARGEDRGRPDQAVGPGAGEEADVVSHHHAVEAAVLGRGTEPQTLGGDAPRHRGRADVHPHSRGLGTFRRAPETVDRGSGPIGRFAHHLAPFPGGEPNAAGSTAIQIASASATVVPSGSSIATSALYLRPSIDASRPRTW